MCTALSLSVISKYISLDHAYVEIRLGARLGGWDSTISTSWIRVVDVSEQKLAGKAFHPRRG